MLVLVPSADASGLDLSEGWPDRWLVTRRVDGDEVSCPVRDLARVPGKEGGPVRWFSWRRGQRHRPGLQFLVSTGRHHGFESLEAARLLLALDFAGDLGGGSYDETARAAGLRWISPDKPGYGGSGYQHKRSLISWADDLAALAGHLALDRFALAGESGGAPFTLAAAHQFAGRVSVVALIAAGGPTSPAERAGMKARNRIMSWLARNAPALNTVPVAAMRRDLASPARRERSLQREMAATPAAAHAGLRTEYEAVADALRPGTRATVQELALINRRWPFPLSEVKTPVHLWHGALDRNAPIAIARRLARELPDATLHVSDSSGHDVGLDRGGEIMSVLASRVK